MVEVGFTILSKSGKSDTSGSGGSSNDGMGFIINEDFDDNTTVGTLSIPDSSTASLINNRISEQVWRCTWSMGPSGGYLVQANAYDIPEGLQGSPKSLNLSFDVGDFSSEGNDTYSWVTIDALSAETTLVGGSWAGPENTYQTFTNNGLALPPDAVKLQLRVRTTQTGIGGQLGDTRVDNIIAELV